MEAAAGALSPVLRKLGELLAGEYNLAKRVKKGVQSLRTELEMIHAVLREVGKVPLDQLQEPVRIWAGKVRDLSCDMEDAVDDFLVRVDEGPSSKPTNMRNRVKKFLKKTTKLFGNGKALHQISSAIKEAEDLATELVGLRKKYELDMRSTSNGATIDPRVLALHKDVGELVGVDCTRDELIKTLICEDGSSKEQLKTISIVGVGGLGKTTLTKAVLRRSKPNLIVWLLSLWVRTQISRKFSRTCSMALTMESSVTFIIQQGMKIYSSSKSVITLWIRGTSS
ncbi:unnamed protein product [Triticum turgidum subsp. durum]|uniref:Disease resistance N-terminal domain-containing protein n=1 Tax=Triticum turgidum subsp. durum TaxID=4567 RepID=A0A9R1BIY5_TRITD|nr:unnamed protein product [Triticum turgidum subsp. durum]